MELVGPGRHRVRADSLFLMLLGSLKKPLRLWGSGGGGGGGCQPSPGKGRAELLCGSCVGTAHPLAFGAMWRIRPAGAAWGQPEQGP